jgi:hypothetical protein
MSMIVIEIDTKDFYKLGYKSWIELHWTLASTTEQAVRAFKDKHLDTSDKVTVYLTPLGYMYPRTP